MKIEEGGKGTADEELKTNSMNFSQGCGCAGGQTSCKKENWWSQITGGEWKLGTQRRLRLRERGDARFGQKDVGDRG